MCVNSYINRHPECKRRIRKIYMRVHWAYTLSPSSVYTFLVGHCVNVQSLGAVDSAVTVTAHVSRTGREESMIDLMGILQ